MENLIKFETALLVKQCDFDLPGTKGYLKDGKIDSFAFNESRKNSTLNKDKHDRNDFICVAFTQEQIQKHLRDVYKIHIKINNYYDESWYWELVSCARHLEEKYDLFKERGLSWNEIELKTYEEAMEIAIVKSLEIILKNKIICV